MERNYLDVSKKSRHLFLLLFPLEFSVFCEKDKIQFFRTIRYSLDTISGMEQQRESTNYRHSTCTAKADGVATADKLQRSKHGENYSIVQGKRKPVSRKTFIGTESIDSQSVSTKEKVKAYEDKPLMTTTKNFIGKSCYNVRCLGLFGCCIRIIESQRRNIRNKLCKEERQQKRQLRVFFFFFVLVGRKGFWLQSSGSGARF